MNEPQPEPEFDIAIVGGGFAGLTLAYRLTQTAPGKRVVLLEGSSRLGGKAITEFVETEEGRFLIEAGPDSFLAAKPWARQLAVDLGLEDRLIPINPIHRPVSVLMHGKLIRLPAGLNLAAPSLLKPFLRSSLLSPSGRARVLREPRIRPSETDRDESVGAFIRRRLGAEMLDWVAEPLMAGIYNGDPDEMSLLATFPQLRVQEREQGGLVRAARQERSNRTDPRQPAFLTLRNGLQELIDALADHVAPIARTGSDVRSFSYRSAGSGSFNIHVDAGEQVFAREVVLAVPAGASADLLAPGFPEIAQELKALRTNPAGSISLAFENGAISRPLPGYGLLMPMKERRPINAITVASKKFDHRAPADTTLLRVFFGGARSPQAMDLDDRALTAVVMDQLRELLGASSEPLLSRVFRWPSGSPQYDVGHLDRVAELDRLLPRGLHLTGSSYRGVGLPDLAKEAANLAMKLGQWL